MFYSTWSPNSQYNLSRKHEFISLEVRRSGLNLLSVANSWNYYCINKVIVMVSSAQIYFCSSLSLSIPISISGLMSSVSSLLAINNSMQVDTLRVLIDVPNWIMFHLIFSHVRPLWFIWFSESNGFNNKYVSVENRNDSANLRLSFTNHFSHCTLRYWISLLSLITLEVINFRKRLFGATEAKNWRVLLQVITWPHTYLRQYLLKPTSGFIIIALGRPI